MWNALFDLCPVYCWIMSHTQELFVHSPLWSLSVEETGFTGPHSLGWTDLATLRGEYVSSKQRAKGFCKMNHEGPVSSVVALEVRFASCAHSNLQALPQGGRTEWRPQPAVCPQNKAMQMGGRQDEGHAMFITTLGDALSGKWRPC